MKIDEEAPEVQRVELPFGDAVTRAARQNFERDVKDGVINDFEWNQSQTQKDYLSDARRLLLRDGENTKPKYHNEHIVLAKPTQ